HQFRPLGSSSGSRRPSTSARSLGTPQSGELSCASRTPKSRREGVGGGASVVVSPRNSASGVAAGTGSPFSGAAGGCRGTLEPHPGQRVLYPWGVFSSCKRVPHRHCPRRAMRRAPVWVVAALYYNSPVERCKEKHR